MSEVDMQKIAIGRIKSGENFFLTGMGGVGKSYVIDAITDQYTIKCAPTGSAALNIGGVTCHSLFSLPLTLPTQEDKYKVGKKMRSLIQEAGVKRILIDECSMLRADSLDLIDTKLKTMMGNKKPFGGLQMVLVGDFFQLEPVIHYTEEDEYYERYESGFCFDADCWDFDSIELTKSYRNINQTQLRVLESIRKEDKWAGRAIEWIEKNSKEYTIDRTNLHLCCYNRDANALNNIQYRALSGQEFIYKAWIEGDFSLKEKPVKEKLKLKVGARVLIKSNGKEYVNGDRGDISFLSEQFIKVTLDRTGTEVMILPAKWDQYDYRVTAKGLEAVVKGTFNQFPITLGYATSIHSSQGSTLDDVALDFGDGCFSHGQAYVAFSRVRDLKNIALVNSIDKESIICDPRVKDFYDNIER